MRNKLIRALAVLLFAAGVLLGLALAAMIIWGDLEAARFDATFRFDDQLTTLDCPVMMTSKEVGTISASFNNPLENPVETTVRVHISQGSATLIREQETKLALAPGETRTLEWTVTPADAAYDLMILARVRWFAKRPIASRDGACGILVLDLPFSNGSLAFYLTLAATFLCIATGAGWWVAACRPLRRSNLAMARAMAVLAASVLAALFAGLFGYWLLGLIILVITVLLIGSIIGYFVNRFGEA